MQTIRLCVLLPALLLLMPGCAPIKQKPVSLDSGFWQEPKIVIGVAVEPIPQTDAYFLGNQGLLDIAINSSNAKPMVERLKSIDIQRGALIADNLANRLIARGFSVKRLEQTVDAKNYPERKSSANPEQFALRDFSALKKEGVDRLLLVTVERIGTERNYYGFIPQGPPRAIFTVKGQLVDLSTQKLLWFQREDDGTPISEPWDQAPDFPNVVEAVVANMDDAAGRFEHSFFATQATAPIQ